MVFFSCSVMTFTVMLSTTCTEACCTEMFYADSLSVNLHYIRSCWIVVGGKHRFDPYLCHCIHLNYPVSSLSLSLPLSLPPALSDFDSLDEKDHEKNNQLAFDVAEREFGISPCMTGKEMSSVVEPDKLSMVMYLSQFYEMFKDTVPPGGESGCYSRAAASVVWFGEVSVITHA